MKPLAAPSLRATLFRVSDVDRAGAFFRETLGCSVGPGPRPGWSTVDVGADQAVLLAPGGRLLAPIHDRWEQQGVIPILKTFDIDAEAANLDRRGVAWVNRPFDYDMKGHGRLGYVLGPDNQPVGIQQRMDDSVREEDQATLAWLASLAGAAPRWLGIGWLIYQAADIVGVRDFMQAAFGWPQLRGTDGFGYMLQVSPTVMLQIAFKGQVQDPQRDLRSEPVLPMVETADVSALQQAIRRHGGSVLPDVDGFAAVADPEGRAWLVQERGA